MEPVNVYAIPGVEKCITTDAALRIVGLTRELARSKTRKQEVVIKRQLAMYILRKKSKMILSEIGDDFDRDHATVIHSVKEINNRLFWDKSFRENVNQILSEL